MTDLELIFTMLGEASTTEIARRKNAQGFPQNRNTAKDGGTVAGNARRELETKSGRPVVSGDNFLELPSLSIPVSSPIEEHVNVDSPAPVSRKQSPKFGKGAKPKGHKN